MKRTKRFFLLALLAVLATAATASALEAGGIAPAQVNPEFVRYLEELESGTAEGRIPPKAYLSRQSTDTSKRAAARATDLPVSFDLVQKGWITAIKDQRSWGTCWDFATTEAMESNLKKETGVAYELSELHLGFFAYYPESAEKPAFDRVAPQDKNQIFYNGGSSSTSRAILSRGTGPVFDADAPYPTEDASNEDFWITYPENREELKRELLEAPNAFRLKESLSFHTSDDIKNALMEYGGLWVAFNSDSTKKDITNPYLYTKVPDSNHAVLLVGWDDTVSRDLFIDHLSDDKSPDIDGAWKIQNSWGASFDHNGQEIPIGDNGYFWISYADRSVIGTEGTSSFVAMSVDNYQRTYSHDPLGSFYALDSGETSAETANVFTAERDEDVVYVGFSTEGYDIGYGIQVYRNVPADGAPDDGTPVFSTPQGGTADFPGYRTVKLDTPVPLGKGERFAVVVTLESDGDDIQVPVEANIDRTSSQATSKPGESFVKDGTDWIEVMELTGRWSDENGNPMMISCTNLTIKAFTNDADRGSSSGSSGCATGAFALILVAVVPLVLRGRQREKI